MSRVIYALIFSLTWLTPIARSQTPITADTKTTATSVSAQNETKPVQAVEECACESQVLPEALAIVNGVRITARDIEKATGESVTRLQAAEAAEAAREQGKYWEYVQLLMRNQSALSMDKLKDYATELALDRPRFDSALESGKFAPMVQRDIEEGMKLGINATPTVFINGRRVSAKSYEELKANVEAAFKALSSKGARSKFTPGFSWVVGLNPAPRFLPDESERGGANQ